MHTIRPLVRSSFLLALVLGILVRSSFAQEVPAGAVAPESPTLIFLLAGQSNMAGLAEVSLLPQAFQTLPSNVRIWNGTAWVKMAAQGLTFGPEIAFAYAVATALPDERIGIVKFAQGGTAIAQWNPKNAQSLYGELMKQYRAALAAAPKARPAAMLWMQGERDSREVATATAYERNLKELVSVTRQHVDEPKLAFLCGLVNPPVQTYPYVNKVRAAQTTLPKQMANVAVVSTDGLPKQADNLHYNVPGQLELGLRFAKAYFNSNNLAGKQAGNGIAPPAADPFARGAIWSGRRGFDPPAQALSEPVWLIVTEREGTSFKGETIILRKGPNSDIYKVDGTATNNNDKQVSFTTEKKGFLQLNFRGTLNKAQLDLKFSGSGIVAGSTVSGNANLMP